MTRNNPFKWGNLLFFLGVILVNTLSVTLPLGGNSTREISDKYHTYLTPAGYAFSIWSLIYLLLAGFVIYQFRSATGSRDSVQSIGIWFILSCVFNMSWLILWHYLYIELSLAAMVLLLISLIVIYRKTRMIDRPTTGESWLIRLPFSIYLGWICVATIVNVSIVLQRMTGAALAWTVQCGRSSCLLSAHCSPYWSATLTVTASSRWCLYGPLLLSHWSSGKQRTSLSPLPLPPPYFCCTACG